MGLRDALETFSEEGQLEQLHDLNADECDAFFELLVLGGLVDGELSHDEADILAEEFLHLPFYAAAHTAEIRREHGFMMRGRMLERIALGELDEMLEGIADRLVTQAHRAAALRALALVLEIEGVQEEELHFALETARAFEIPGNEALEILRKAWELNHPPFG